MFKYKILSSINNSSSFNPDGANSTFEIYDKEWYPKNSFIEFNLSCDPVSVGSVGTDPFNDGINYFVVDKPPISKIQLKTNVFGLDLVDLNEADKFWKITRFKHSHPVCSNSFHFNSITNNYDMLFENKKLMAFPNTFWFDNQVIPLPMIGFEATNIYQVQTTGANSFGMNYFAGNDTPTDFDDQFGINHPSFCNMIVSKTCLGSGTNAGTEPDYSALGLRLRMNLSDFVHTFFEKDVFKGPSTTLSINWRETSYFGQQSRVASLGSTYPGDREDRVAKILESGEKSNLNNLTLSKLKLYLAVPYNEQIQNYVPDPRINIYSKIKTFILPFDGPADPEDSDSSPVPVYKEIRIQPNDGKLKHIYWTCFSTNNNTNENLRTRGFNTYSFITDVQTSFNGEKIQDFVMDRNNCYYYMLNKKDLDLKSFENHMVNFMFRDDFSKMKESENIYNISFMAGKAGVLYAFTVFEDELRF